MPPVLDTDAGEPLGAATQLLLENEFGRGDVNKFAALAEFRCTVAPGDGHGCRVHAGAAGSPSPAPAVL
jgi:hypothetical protein